MGDDALVTAVIVTYGDRRDLVEQVLRSVERQAVNEVIIVGNGLSDPVSSGLEAIARGLALRTRFVNLQENLGSAAGYSAGMRAIRDGAGEGGLIWLLDDDNAAEPGALSALRDRLSELSATHGAARVAVSPARPCRPLTKLLRAGVSVADAFPARSSFLNFDLVSRVKRTRIRSTCRREEIVLPYAPYGGLLFHRNLLDTIGLPDERLVVYEDDVEFTFRIGRVGGVIGYAPAAVIRDIEAPWYSSAEGWGPAKLVLARDERRVYYSVRNRVFFETQYWRRSRARFVGNGAIVMLAILVSGFSTRRLARTRLILRAVQSGYRGHLGTYDFGGS